MAQVSTLEAGQSRVLAMLSKKAKPLPELPSFDDVTEYEVPSDSPQVRSPFIERLELANRVGRYKDYDPNAIEDQDDIES